MSNIINRYHLIAYVADGFIRARKPAKWAAGESRKNGQVRSLLPYVIIYIIKRFVNNFIVITSYDISTEWKRSRIRTYDSWNWSKLFMFITACHYKVKPFMYGHLSFCRRYKAAAKNTLLTIVYIKNTEMTAVKYSPNSHI